MTGALADEVLELRLHPDAPLDPAAPAYNFEIFLRGTATRVGELGLRLDRDDPALAGYAGHVGYGIEPAHRGRRHALRACRLVAPFVRDHGFAEVWITTVPDNAASCRTLELLGARYVDTVPVPEGSTMRVLGMHRVRRYLWRLDGS